MSTFFVGVDRGALTKVIKQINAFDGKARLRVESALKKGTQAVQREAKQRAPKKTGKLRKSIKKQFSVTKLEGRVYSNLSYAHLVEFGYRPHIVKPKTRKAMRFEAGGETAFAKRSQIPKYTGKPFMEPAYKYCEQSIIEAVKKAVSKNETIT